MGSMVSAKKPRWRSRLARCEHGARIADVPPVTGRLMLLYGGILEGLQGRKTSPYCMLGVSM